MRVNIGLRRQESQVSTAHSRSIAWGVLLALVLGILMASRYWATQPVLKVGEIAPQDVLATHQVVDRPELLILRQQALKAVPAAYVTDPQALSGAIAASDGVFKKISALAQQAAANRASFTPAKAQTLWQAQFGQTLAPQAIYEVLTMSQADLAALRHDLTAAFRTVLSSAGYKQDQVGSEVAQLRQINADYGLDNAQTALLDLVAQETARPNLIYSRSETQHAQQQALARVRTPYIYPGQLVVAKGTRVTAQQMDILRELGLLKSASNTAITIAGIVIAALWLAAVGWGLFRFRPAWVADRQHVLLLGTVVLFTAVMARVLSGTAPYVVPLAAGAMLLGAQIDELAAPVLSLLLGLLVWLATDLSALVALPLIFGSGVVSLLLPKSAQRADYLRVGVWGGLASAGGVLLMSLLHGGAPTLNTLENMAWAMSSGVFSAIIAIGVLPVLEIVFDVLTPTKLLELSNPKQPLLRRLLMEAPGTYHHSLMVANLAEAGADAIGADGLLARVGAYYHDIGKLRRPFFFVENKFGQENPHDRLTPSLSTLIITSHVKDGVEMAQAAKLPEELVSFIREHHGTTLVKFFYAKAVEKGEKVEEEDFRYGGPKPQSRETAICMLADTVEAAVRSLPNPSPGRIEGFVRQLMWDKLFDGQLDECSLRLNDLDRIAKAFVQVLMGAFHTRIAYPKAVDPSGRGKGASVRGQPKPAALRARR